MKLSHRQIEMLRAVAAWGDPGHVYRTNEEGKYERTLRSLINRGLIEDAREIAEDGQTVIMPGGRPWRVSEDGKRAMQQRTPKP